MGVYDNTIGAVLRQFGWEDPPVTNANVPARKDYPNKEDVDMANMYDTTYGYNAAPGITGGGTGNMKRMDREIFNALQAVPEPHGQRQPMDYQTRDELLSNFIAAQRDPIAALGFDPSRIIYGDSGPFLTAAGMYDRRTDAMMYDASGKGIPVHESMHRGMNMMRKSGQLDNTLAEKYPEEEIVRMLMADQFGPIEAEGERSNPPAVKSAQRALEYPVNRELLTELRKRAATMYHAKDRKMGPR